MEPMQPKRKRTKKLYSSGASGAPLDSNSSHAKVCEQVPPGARVLDVGCGSGELAALLSARGGQVWGSDVNPDALALAKKHCVDTRLADLEDVDVDQLFPGVHFDAVVFADVLEHVREPWRLLESARNVLAPGGKVVASIPNFSHAAVRLAVLGGAMPYRTLGILDDTHLRFFTLAGVASLFAESGFRIEAVERTVVPFGAESDLVPDVRILRAPAEIEQRVRAHPESETLQFILRALPMPGAWNMSTLRARLHDVEGHVQEQTVGIANLEVELAGRVEQLAAAVDSERAAHARAVEAEANRDEQLAVAAERERQTHARAVGAEAARDEKAATLEALREEMAALQARFAERTENLQALDALGAPQSRLDEATQTLRAEEDRVSVAEATRAAALAHAQTVQARSTELEAEALRFQDALSVTESERDDALARAESAAAALRDMHRRIEELEQNLDQVYAELARLEQAHAAELDGHRARSHTLEAQLRDRDEALATRERSVADRERIIAQHEGTIAEHERTIAEHEGAIEVLALTNREHERVAAERELVLADAQHAAADLDERLTALRAAAALQVERARQDAFVQLALEHQIAGAGTDGEQFWRESVRAL
jgi:methionine biosynthesis protein MetW